MSDHQDRPYPGIPIITPPMPIPMKDPKEAIGARTCMEQRADVWPNERKTQPGHKGVKLARFDLLPMDALWQVTKVFGLGARKYAARNWERGYEWSKSVGAAQRHIALWQQGEDNDEETGLSHLAHAITNLLFLLAFSLRCVGTDDRAKFRVGMTAEVTNPEDIEAARKEVEQQ